MLEQQIFSTPEQIQDHYNIEFINHILEYASIWLNLSGKKLPYIFVCVNSVLIEFIVAFSKQIKNEVGFKSGFINFKLLNIVVEVLSFLSGYKIYTNGMTLEN